MTEQAPAVSVVIPCGGDLATLPLQLAALAAQERAPRFEVLVANNGAPGELDALPTQHTRLPYELRIVAASDRRGSSYARNVGAAHARSELLMFCDADDVVSAHWVRCGTRAFETTPVWTGVTTSLPDADFRAGAGAVQARIDWGDLDPPPVPDTPGAPTVLMGGNFGIRRELFEELGGFDVSVAHHGDDNDMAARIRACGRSIPRWPSVRIAYRQHPGLVPALRQAQRDSRAAYLLALRSGTPSPPPRVLLAALGLTARALCSPLGMLLRGRWQPVALVTRWFHVLGTLDGMWCYGVLRRIPPRELGVGLDTTRA